MIYFTAWFAIICLPSALAFNPVLESMRAQLKRDGEPPCDHSHPSNMAHHLRFTEELRGSKREVCLNGSSRVVCAHHEMWRGIPCSHCEVHGLSLDIANFERWNTGALRPGFDEAYAILEPPPPFLGVDCALDAGFWRRESFGWGGQFLLFSALQGSQTPATCMGWVEEPIFVMGNLYGRGSPWHTLEGLTNDMLSYAIHGLDPRRTLVVVGDSGPAPLPEDSLKPWERIIMSAHPVEPLASLVRPFYGAPAGAKLCFRRAAFSIHGGASIMSRSIHEGSLCAKSTPIRTFASIAAARMRLAPVGNTRVVTFAVRVNASGDYHSPEALERGHARRLEPQVQLDMLERLRQSAASRGYSFDAVNLAALGSQEQIRVVHESSVFMGMHGAHFAHLLWLPEGHPVVELQHEARWGYDHHENMAKWSGHPWVRVDVRMVARDPSQAIENAVSGLAKAIDML